MPRLSRFTVGLRIFADDLNPEEISLVLGTEPTKLRIKGLPVAGQEGRIAHTSSWQLDSRLPEEADPSEQILSILKSVSGDSRVWEELRQKFKVDLFAGVFLADWNEGFELSPEVSEALAVRGLTIGFDIYGHSAYEE